MFETAANIPCKAPIAQGGNLGILFVEDMCKTAQVKDNMANEQTFVSSRTLPL